MFERMLESYAVLKRIVERGINEEAEPGSHTEKIVVAAIVCGVMAAIDAPSEPIYDENGTLIGCCVDGVNLWIDTNPNVLVA